MDEFQYPVRAPLTLPARACLAPFSDQPNWTYPSCPNPSKLLGQGQSTLLLNLKMLHGRDNVDGQRLGQLRSRSGLATKRFEKLPERRVAERSRDEVYPQLQFALTRFVSSGWSSMMPVRAGQFPRADQHYLSRHGRR